MILEPKKIKSVTVSIVSPSVCHEMMGPDEGYRGRTGDVVGVVIGHQRADTLKP